MSAPARGSRRLTLLDSSVLIAALACTLAMARLGPMRRSVRGVVHLDLGRAFEAAYLRQEFSGHNLLGRLADLYDVTTVLLPIWTLAIFVLRWLPPRPPLRVLLGQPGLWACGTALGAMLLIPASWIYFRLEVDAILIPGVVATSWLILALSRRWQSERSWVDLAGRFLGSGWIALALLMGAVEWLNWSLWG